MEIWVSGLSVSQHPVGTSKWTWPAVNKHWSKWPLMEQIFTPLPLQCLCNDTAAPEVLLSADTFINILSVNTQTGWCAGTQEKKRWDCRTHNTHRRHNADVQLCTERHAYGGGLLDFNYEKEWMDERHQAGKKEEKSGGGAGRVQLWNAWRAGTRIRCRRDHAKQQSPHTAPVSLHFTSEFWKCGEQRDANSYTHTNLDWGYQQKYLFHLSWVAHWRCILCETVLPGG